MLTTMKYGVKISIENIDYLVHENLQKDKCGIRSLKGILAKIHNAESTYFLTVLCF